MRTLGIVLLGTALLAGCASNTSSMRGSEVRVRYAEVLGVDRVEMPSKAPAGAIIGGFTGLLIGRNESFGRQIATGAAGAAIGGLATHALEGDRRGYGYNLQFVDGSTSRFITEKGYLQTGDCVAVERGEYANVRRVPSNMCGGRAAAAAAPHPKHMADAQQCLLAKEQLLTATTDEEINASARKVEILCAF